MKTSKSSKKTLTRKVAPKKVASQRKFTKSKVTQKTLNEMKQFLLKRRALLDQDLKRMIEDLTPVHDVIEEFQGGSFERETLISLVESQERAIRDLDKALKRIASNTYGFCLECQEPIDINRLKALPATERCFACQKIHEQSF